MTHLLKIRLAFLVWLLSFAVIGCGKTPYPQPHVLTDVGTPQVCHQCLQPIATVTKQNQVVIAGVRYNVCSEQCAHELSSSLDVQGLSVPGADK